MTGAKTSPKSKVQSPKSIRRGLGGMAAYSGFGLLCVALWVWSGVPAAAQTPLSNLVFTVGTTIQDSGGHNWSYVLIGTPQPQLLAGKHFAIFSKPGFPTNAGTFALRGTIFQQSDPTAINTLLNESIALGENLTSLSNALNTLLYKVTGIAGLPLPQKVVTGFQVAATDPNIAQLLGLLGHVNPGLTL